MKSVGQERTEYSSVQNTKFHLFWHKNIISANDQITPEANRATKWAAEDADILSRLPSDNSSIITIVSVMEKRNVIGYSRYGR